MFAIACNVMQTIGFAKEIVFLCRDVYKNGISTEINDLRDRSEQLDKMVRDIPELEVEHGVSESELSNIAQRCLDITKKLGNEIKSLDLGKPRSLGSTRTAIKTIWRKDPIKKLEKDLSKCQALMQTDILLRLE